MTDLKKWARLANEASAQSPSVVAEIVEIDASLVPGRDIFATLVFVEIDPNSAVAEGWTYDGANFSPATVARSVGDLAGSLVAAATAACAALTATVVPDQVHQNAYVNAAAMVGPGAVVPTVDPTKAAFAAMAASFDKEPAVFASMVVAIAAASWQLQAAQVTLSKAAVAAQTPADLGVALAAFETALAAIVSAIGAAGVTVSAPAAIIIPGL